MKTAAAETPEAGRPCGPLKIDVIGANGKSGSLIAREAAARGNDVAAIPRRARLGARRLRSDGGRPSGF